ncbi:MAG: hypothetical protein QOJ21_1689 [Solirubrobacteraceae bacterium]|jgi:hypothetical protein|nr:hypothetical protein [Solirubrobacteraceae bacterium]
MSSGSSRRAILPVCLTVAALAASVATPASAATTPRDPSVTCNVKRDGRKLGATYVTSLRATGLACPKAKSVVKAFNACRRANGGAGGSCTASVQGFRCSERRGPAIPTQYSSSVTCKSGARAVRFVYTQFT